MKAARPNRIDEASLRRWLTTDAWAKDTGHGGEHVTTFWYTRWDPGLYGDVLATYMLALRIASAPASPQVDLLIELAESGEPAGPPESFADLMAQQDKWTPPLLLPHARGPCPFRPSPGSGRARLPLELRTALGEFAGETEAAGLQAEYYESCHEDGAERWVDRWVMVSECPCEVPANRRP
jgi:hypothetical protein